MSRCSLRIRLCLLTGLGLATGAPPALAHPRFVFDAAGSTGVLNGWVSASDSLAPGPVIEQGGANGFVSPFWYSGGRADFGTTVNIVAEDGNKVTASANPLVRLDGDGTHQMRIAWKAWTLLDADLLGELTAYQASGTASARADLALVLMDLQPGTVYTVWYRWTFEADAQEEHELPLPPGDDPAAASGQLSFDIAGGLGPGQVFDVSVDNVGSGSGAYEYDADSGAVQFLAVTDSEPIAINLNALVRRSALTDPPPGGDLSSCRFRGTLTLRRRSSGSSSARSSTVTWDLGTRDSSRLRTVARST